MYFEGKGQGLSCGPLHPACADVTNDAYLESWAVQSVTCLEHWMSKKPYLFGLLVRPWTPLPISGMKAHDHVTFSPPATPFLGPPQVWVPGRPTRIFWEMLLVKYCGLYSLPGWQCTEPFRHLCEEVVQHDCLFQSPTRCNPWVQAQTPDAHLFTPLLPGSGRRPRFPCFRRGRSFPFWSMYMGCWILAFVMILERSW